MAVENMDPFAEGKSLLLRTLEAKVMEYGAWTALSPEVFARVEHFDPIAESVARQITLGWKMRIPIHQIAAWEMPKDWWEAVKDRFAPKWFLKKWPVQHNKFKLEQALDTLIHGQQSRVIFSVNDTMQQADAHSPFRTSGYCGICEGPVPVFITKDGPKLNYPIKD